MNQPDTAPEEPSANRNRSEVLLERLSWDLGAYGENLIFVRDHVARMSPKVDKMAEDVESLKAIARGNTKDIAGLKKDVRILKSDVKIIKGDLKKFDDRLVVVETSRSS